MKKVFALALAALLVFGALAQAEITQRGKMRIKFEGEIAPTRLPRHGLAPIKVTVGAFISSTKASVAPPPLRKIEISINRHGVLDGTGLPICDLDDIQPASTENALAACRDSLVGTGSFEAKVLVPQQSPFPSAGKIHAFYGDYEGKPAILAHIFGAKPVPTSVTLPFLVTHSKGTFGTRLSAPLPTSSSAWGYVTGLSITLHRRYSYHGEARSFVSASCPAPKGFSAAPFPLATARLGFKGRTVNLPPLSRACKVGGR